jgi:alkylation response protein AidB-like acyl-CoA dehydrogenase
MAMTTTIAAATEPHEHRADRAELLRRAGDLAPILRERAALAEKLRHVPMETVDDLRRSKLLRICQPARFGGGEEGWDTLCECLIALARGDGSQAWVASVYAAMAWQTALFGDEAQHDVWERMSTPSSPDRSSRSVIGSRRSTAAIG